MHKPSRLANPVLRKVLEMVIAVVVLELLFLLFRLGAGVH